MTSDTRVDGAVLVERWFSDYARYEQDGPYPNNCPDDWRTWRAGLDLAWPGVRNVSRALAEIVDRDATDLDSRSLWLLSGTPYYFSVSADTWNEAWILCNKVRTRFGTPHQAATRVVADRLTVDVPVATDPDDGWRYLSAKAVETIFFGGSAKLRKTFLAKHPEVATERPTTKSGRPHARRLNVDVPCLIKALRRDEYYENDPEVQRRIARKMKQAEINEKLANATASFFGL